MSRMCRLRLILSVLVAILGVTLASDTLDNNNKRGPSGFQGVRGKKSIRDTYPDNSFYTSEVLDKRIPSAGFHGMRGKKLHTEKNELLLPLSLPKRAPMGFMGMRGKKEIGLLADELDKRASKGFLGMRGKKEFENNQEDNMLNDYYMEKRAPNGFMGMRGKKEYSLFIGDEKRAPSNTFFGMRGKKQPSRSGFFVMRGKKYPYEFREKFVGVRGKKQSTENGLPNFSVPEIDTDNYAANLDLNELMLLLSEDRNTGSNWEKEDGPSGFPGIHG